MIFRRSCLDISALRPGYFAIFENGSAGSPALFCNVTGGSGQFAQAYLAETGSAVSAQVNSTALVETIFACAA